MKLKARLPKTSETLNWNELIGGHIEILGKPFPLTGHEPAVLSKYDDYKSVALQAMINEALNELVARCCHFAKDRWTNTVVAGAHVVENEALANYIRSGAVNQSGKERKAKEKLHRQFVAEDRHEAIQAARALAETAYLLTEKLEALAGAQAEVIKEVAKHFAEWPFNLGLERVASKKTQTIKCELRRATTAKLMMEKIGVGLESKNTVETNPLAGKDSSPFRIAAEQVYRLLCLMQKNPHYYFDRHGESGPADEKGYRPITNLKTWRKDLFAGALTVPMRVENSSAWWAVAKCFLDELWAGNRGVFDLLIAECRKKYLVDTKPSVVKNRIINQYLKPAFKGIAIKT